MKIVIAALLSGVVLSGAGINLPGRVSAGGGGAPAMELCVAGLGLAFGGARPVSLSMSQNGRCGCPDACSAAMLRLAFAGLSLRV